MTADVRTLEGGRKQTETSVLRVGRTAVMGTEIFHEEVGSGPPLVLLHGLNDSHRTWRRILPYLAPSRRVLMPDLPGCGLSARPDACYSLDWQARVMSEWLGELGIERADVVGHSYGGGVAQYMLLVVPQRIRRLALVAAGGLGREVSLELRLAALPWVVERLGQPFMAPVAAHALRGVGGVVDAEGARWMREVNARPGTARAFARTVRDVISWRGQTRHFLDRARDIRVLPPIQLFWGDADRVIPYAQAVQTLTCCAGPSSPALLAAAISPSINSPRRWLQRCSSSAMARLTTCGAAYRSLLARNVSGTWSARRPDVCSGQGSSRARRRCKVQPSGSPPNRNVAPMHDVRLPFVRAYRAHMGRGISMLEDLYRRAFGRPRSDPPPPASVGTPLDAVNEQFHSAHQAARSAAKHDDPVLVVLADDLIVFDRGKRAVYSFSPPTFHVLKSVVHAPVALHALCQADHDAARSSKLVALQTRVQRALEEMSSHDLDADSGVCADMRLVLERTYEAARELQQNATGARVDAFAAGIGPVLLRLAHAATRIQLAALHGHTQRVLADLSPAQRAALHVVVAGDHQARARSLPMQYFKKLLREPADVEHQVTYAEGVRDERAAFDLVGAQRLDRRLARAFFGDEKRLQRDILGDAAAAELKGYDLPPL